jgi:hypothetical protein
MIKLIGATKEEKLLLFKLAAQFTDNVVKDEIILTYPVAFEQLFESRFDTIVHAYNKFKKEQV